MKKCDKCGNGYFATILDGHIADSICPECLDMICEREYDPRDDDENDDILERQELEDYCETDEAYGHYGDRDDDMYGSGAGWDDRGQDDFFGDEGY